MLTLEEFRQSRTLGSDLAARFGVDVTPDQHAASSMRMNATSS
jgi:hypothetical protein